MASGVIKKELKTYAYSGAVNDSGNYSLPSTAIASDGTDMRYAKVVGVDVSTPRGTFVLHGINSNGGNMLTFRDSVNFAKLSQSTAVSGHIYYI